MPESYYEENGVSFFEQSVGVDMSPIYDRFTALLPPGGTVCDAGCGSGRDAKAFAEHGFHVTAFDASPTLVALAREHSGLPVDCLTFQEMSYNGAFDGIWCCASLLHVPMAEEQEVLGRLVDALKPGGILYLSYKVGLGEGYVGLRLFRYHTKGTLRAALGAFSNLDIQYLWETADHRPGRMETWLNCIASKRP